jgi:biopolymer transport protein ExbD
MKFPRNAKILRNQVDVTPFAGVFFCLLIFVLLGSLVYTPGFQIMLPQSASTVQGVNGPVVAVAVDANGQFYFQNAPVQATNLQTQLKKEAAQQNEPVTLVVLADKAVTNEQLTRLYDLALGAGIRQIQLGVLPRAFDPHVP